MYHQVGFNSQPPEGGWVSPRVGTNRVAVFQLTAARRRLATEYDFGASTNFVSTHSRPKAAGADTGAPTLAKDGFNSQPPEGGWTFTIALRFTC